MEYRIDGFLGGNVVFVLITDYWFFFYYKLLFILVIYLFVLFGREVGLGWKIFIFIYRIIFREKEKEIDCVG